ncbi:hypothetical protein [Cupriavidus pauculus]|uniref:hypothetical protein n=1 Tax=Cupriavidus pauculus TaxID=82633 RepID=UPI000781432E|nr:hypothetical protein [Cupriavidus pauculus]
MAVKLDQILVGGEGVQALRITDDKLDWRAVPFSRVTEIRAVPAGRKWEVQAVLVDSAPGQAETLLTFDARAEAVQLALDLSSIVWKK